MLLRSISDVVDIYENIEGMEEYVHLAKELDEFINHSNNQDLL